MRKLQNLLAIALLASAVTLGTPVVTLAEGNAESPGITATSNNTVPGNAESPGIITSVLIYLSAIL